MDFENLKIGMKESISKTITETDIILYSGISLDCNPVHLNKEYAEASRFKKRIAHGMLTAGLISAVLGTKLPGEGTIYLEQNLKFKQPVYLGDTITATCEIIDIIKEKRKVILSTICINQDEKIILTGEAKVMK
ncbi:MULTISPECIES: MaoC family dehydratase [Fusobacterium]|jgi:3-hydroxybutyryl-CoA dehydratase|uniref:MaoC family dehydratase n=1 Tax=Fusobacterium TaxID=848 RepID=UPI0008A33C27|nr:MULTISPECIES: MaoC family dehydratase [Fusobacterium]MCD7979270.1 MaoC family dehydratase [Fusobacterium sp.]MCF0169287.1 MaoC family dehydratase [Fusobacterium varium]MCF2673453.1 MaoC family dehydratase [Fusobacterium varium]MCI6033723.1 MaoC family dehydratase [Fusobacterium varium]MDY4004630.1 MaoC family dehydratase [Fusobacterium varium]